MCGNFRWSCILAAVSLFFVPLARGQNTSHQTRIEMRNVNLHPDDAVTLYVDYLSGRLSPTVPNTPPVFDDKHSFAIAIESARIVISTAVLTTLLNRSAFSDPKSPIRNVKVSTDGQRIRQKGTLKKGVSLPFEMEGSVQVTSDGRIRIHTAKLKVAHLPVKGLLNIFGVETADLVSGKHMRGVVVEDEDFILDPRQLIPAPKIEGRITRVEVINDALVKTYGNGVRAQRLSKYQNYVAYRGGTIRFGKLTMRDADLQLIDASPRDPFDFSIDHYKDQLFAGYSKTTPAFGLVVFMPDYYKVEKQSRARAEKPRQ